MARKSRKELDEQFPVARKQANRGVRFRALDAWCGKNGYPRTDRGGGGGRLGTRRAS